MPVDDERLTRLRRFEDPEAGIAEEFLAGRIGPWRSFALLSVPLRKPRALGWVICPSLGPEHGNLRRLETLLARGLAGHGFPVLRIRPDVSTGGGASGEIDLSARTAEVEEAAALLGEACAVEGVALLGMLFGGTVAALTAERLDARAIVLVEPVLRGRRYLRETVRRQAIAELMAAEEGEPGALAGAAQQPSSRPFEELAAEGQVWIRGMRLSQAEYERIAEVDLLERPPAFGGSALLVGISPSGSVPSGLAALRDRLLALGGDVELEVFQDPLPAPFGEYYFRSTGLLRIDTRSDLDQRIGALTTDWALRTLAPDPQHLPG